MLKPPRIKGKIENFEVDREPLPIQPFSLPSNRSLEISQQMAKEIECADIIYSDILYSDSWRLKKSNKENINTINNNAANKAEICFEYRVVELPFSLAQLLPLRNFTEIEWRSFGVTMRRGWENYDRRGCEYNVLLFRRRTNETDLKTELAFQQWMLKKEREIHNKLNDDWFNRPLWVFPLWPFEVEPEKHLTSTAYENMLLCCDQYPLNFKAIHTAILDFWQFKIDSAL